jgi:hypothetical protein
VEADLDLEVGLVLDLEVDAVAQLIVGALTKLKVNVPVRVVSGLLGLVVFVNRIYNMPVLLTYDLKKTSETIHAELKNHLKNKYGYSDRIQSNQGNWYYLPNTTLRKENTSPSQVSNEFLLACKEMGATWEKYIGVQFSVSIFDNK